jgi:phage terminase large subunit-like protein
MGTQDTGAVWRDGKPQVDHALLENQMCSYTGGPGEESPDALDALVWAFTELMVGNEPTAEDHLDAMRERVQKKRGSQ